MTFTLQLMKQLDQDDSGMIEFKEFVRVMARRAAEEKINQKEEEFMEAFKVCVVDNFTKVNDTIAVVDV